MTFTRSTSSSTSRILGLRCINYHLLDYSLQNVASVDLYGVFVSDTCILRSVKVNLLPIPVSGQGLSAQILPPCASIILFDIDNPNPVPALFTLLPRKKSVKSRGSSSGSMPIPVSSTSTATSSL